MVHYHPGTRLHVELLTIQHTQTCSASKVASYAPSLLLVFCSHLHHHHTSHTVSENIGGARTSGIQLPFCSIENRSGAAKRRTWTEQGCVDRPQLSWSRPPLISVVEPQRVSCGGVGVMCLEFVGAELGLNRVFLLLTWCACTEPAAVFDAPVRCKGTAVASWKETETRVRAGYFPKRILRRHARWWQPRS
jgi:hypothetical protein